MKKLLIVCGPTATGKTELALKLSGIIGGEIISADSRQVYKGMNIGTGKDMDKVGKVLGYDLALPTEEFSVAAYMKFAGKAIKSLWEKGKIPILVGGTGLYIKAVVDGIGTSEVPRNETLRKNLETKGVDELFDILASDDPLRAAGMNSSDMKNPRRLIRAIEIAIGGIESKGKKHGNTEGVNADTLFIGLTAPKEYLDTRISKRVGKRIFQGIEREIDTLLKRGVTWDMQSMYSLGYRQFRGYFEEGESIDRVVESWVREEQKYAKRQMVWFKKDKRINWFEVNDPEYSKKVEEMVKNWYTRANAKKN